MNILTLVRRFFHSENEFEKWLDVRLIHNIPAEKFNFIKNNFDLSVQNLSNILNISPFRINKLKEIIEEENATKKENE